MKDMVLSLILSAGSTGLMIRVLSPVAQKIDLVDRPHGRKTHTDVTPLVGGIAMMIGVIFGSLFLPISLSELRTLFTGIAVLGVVGVLDDHQDIEARWKFIAQIMVALLMTNYSDLVVTHLGSILGSKNQGLGIMSIPFSVIAVVGAINAINMIDGHDGVAGSVACLTLIGIAALCFASGESSALRFLMIVIISVAVFLVFNTGLGGKYQSQVFMGDAGSMFLGLIIAYFLIDFSSVGRQVIRPTTTVWLIGLPLLDMFAVMLRRVLRRKNIASADRTHIHHILNKKGLSKYQITGTLFLIQLCFVTFGVAANLFLAIPDWILFWSVFPVIGIYMILIKPVSP
jgi:UDP-GlcNAc:undecaprenyl-phosphate/decaprenyl-phosphate GlcNAc-1-phosphate transferase